MLQKTVKQLAYFNSELKHIKAIEQYVESLFSKDSTGHDFYHMKRVARLAKIIAQKENADVFVCEAGALVHDIGDKKLFEHPEQAIEKMKHFFRSIKIEEYVIEQILIAIKDISFRNQGVPETKEGKIIQDADRLDAIGAIGIARTFAYGGAANQLIYDPESNKNTTIHHFYEKLLLIKDQMNTNYAKQIAEKRHQFMQLFLEKFYNEW